MVGGKWGQIWEWVLEGPPSSSQRVGGNIESCATHRLLLCLAGSRDCQDGEGEEKGEVNRQGQSGQGRSQDKRGRESGRTRRDNRACVLVTDRARERGWDPMSRGSLPEMALNQGQEWD